MNVHDAGTLPRRLGPLDAASLVVSNVIGVGIFTTPALVSCLVPQPIERLGVWLVGGLLAWIGATAYAELASRQPRAGGEYVYIREAFGPIGAFLTGWTSFVAGFSGAIAAASVAVSLALVRLVAPAGYANESAGGLHVVVALAIIAALAAVHVRGVEPGRLLQNNLTVIKIGALVLVAAAGLAATHPAPTAIGSAAGGSNHWLLALIPVMFSYSGWNAAAYVAEEVRDPQRNVPRALLAGTLIVVSLYVIVNLAVIPLLPAAACGATGLETSVVGRIWGAAAERITSTLTIVILLSCISAMTMAGPRVYFAMARDGAFPAAVARLHPRFHTPAAAVIAQALWSAALVLSGTFEQLVTYTGFAVVLFAGVAVASLFVVRHRGPGTPTAFRMRGYPIAPAIFVLMSAGIVVNAIRERPYTSAIGLAIIMAGLPIYYVARRAASARAPFHSTCAVRHAHTKEMTL